MAQEEPVDGGACLAEASASAEPAHTYRSKRAKEIGIQDASSEWDKRTVAGSLA